MMYDLWIELWTRKIRTVSMPSSDSSLPQWIRSYKRGQRMLRGALRALKIQISMFLRIRTNSRTKRWPWSTCRLTTLWTALRMSLPSSTSKHRLMAPTHSRSSLRPLGPTKAITSTRWRLLLASTMPAWSRTWIRRPVLLAPRAWMSKLVRMCTLREALSSTTTIRLTIRGSASPLTHPEVLIHIQPLLASLFLATIKREISRSSSQWSPEMSSCT